MFKSRIEFETGLGFLGGLFDGFLVGGCLSVVVEHVIQNVAKAWRFGCLVLSLWRHLQLFD